MSPRCSLQGQGRTQRQSHLDIHAARRHRHYLVSHCTERETEAQRRRLIGPRSRRTPPQVPGSCPFCGVSVIPMGTGYHGLSLPSQVPCHHTQPSQALASPLSELQGRHLQHGSASLAAGEDYERDCGTGPLEEKTEPWQARALPPRCSAEQRAGLQLPSCVS